MKNKSIMIILATALLFTACGSTVDPSSGSSDSIIADSGVAEASVEVEQDLFDVTITIPADFAGESTQEELDETCKTLGYQSITLNDDGSVTYVMTKKQHKQMIEEIAAQIRSSLQEMIGSEDYPNITDVSVNDSFTEYTVTTKSTELSIEESLSVFVFNIYSIMYSSFTGKDIDNIHVDFVNADTGEIIDSSDSSDMGN